MTGISNGIGLPPVSEAETESALLALRFVGGTPDVTGCPGEGSPVDSSGDATSDEAATSSNAMA